MELDVVTTLITSVGFPSACVIAMGIYISKFNIKNDERLFELVAQNQDYNKAREDKLYTLIGKSQEQLDRLEDSFEDYVVVLGKLRDDMNAMKEDLHNIEDKVK